MRARPFADGRRLRQPRGKGLGGSSLINGMLYARGHARDYDEWRQLGLDGWSYEDVLPYFKRSENHWGAEGPLTTRAAARCRSPSTSPTPGFYPRLIEAVNTLGHKTQIDHHGPDQEGWGSPDISIHNGWRGSTAARFLFPAMKRPNLTVITGALATRLELHGGRAVALHYRRGGEDHRLEAGREIVLSGRRLQHAAAPAAVGHRPGRRAARARCRGGARPPRGRPQPAGPPVDRDGLGRRARGHADQRPALRSPDALGRSNGP
jgi:choline dehydrogenase